MIMRSRRRYISSHSSKQICHNKYSHNLFKILRRIWPLQLHKFHKWVKVLLPSRHLLLLPFRGNFTRIITARSRRQELKSFVLGFLKNRKILVENYKTPTIFCLNCGNLARANTLYILTNSRLSPPFLSTRAID